MKGAFQRRTLETAGPDNAGTYLANPNTTMVWHKLDTLVALLDDPPVRSPRGKPLETLM